MRQPPIALLCLLAACAIDSGPSPATMLAESTTGSLTRLTVSGDRVVVIASPIDYLALPSPVREACESLAPKGTITFCGRERSDRGVGYRVEMRLKDPAPHERSMLFNEAGRVLEQGRTLDLSQAPKQVLKTALSYGDFIERIEVVSRPALGDCWRVVIRDRSGRRFAATINPNGALKTLRRRTQSRVDS